MKHEILQLLKNNYENATGGVMQSDDLMQSTQAAFYFKNLDDNLIELMGKDALKAYSDGSGNELEKKMKALRSSSAMTFNLFGNDNAKVRSGKFFDSGIYKVSFEMQLATIRRNPHKANIDAVLQSDTEVIFCEMKMMEWILNKPGTLSASYLDKERYYDQDSYDAFRECAEIISKRALKQYDAFQMFKHTLAIYNYATANRGNIPQKICLVNCVWELGEVNKLSDKAKNKYLEKLHLEHEEFAIFHASTAPIRKRFLELGFEFDIVYMNIADFISNFVKTDAELKYLGRYL